MNQPLGVSSFSNVKSRIPRAEGFHDPLTVYDRLSSDLSIISYED